jgi:hypothetical protein
MREGRGINHPAYAFLSFFKVLEVAFPDGKKRATWIDDNVAASKGLASKKLLKASLRTASLKLERIYSIRAAAPSHTRRSSQSSIRTSWTRCVAYHRNYRS